MVNVLNNSRVIYFPSTSWQKEFEIVKTRYTVTLAMTASFVLGALAAQTLHAQATRLGQKPAHGYFEDEPSRRSAAKLLSKDEARRIALSTQKS